LRDLIGEERLHAALRDYLAEVGNVGLPYATTVDLMRHLTAATPDSLAYAITDYSETITLWDVKTDSVTATKLPDGDYRVTVVGTAGKLRADSHGAETPVAMGDYIDVEVLAAPKAGARIGEPLAKRKVKVTGPTVRAEFTVKPLPARGGIDPYNLLIDRNPGDNSRDVRN
jgi:ABC-2 type transport system permease protein